MKFLGYRIFGILAKDDPEENEDEMKYDAFFCFRFELLQNKNAFNLNGNHLRESISP